MYAIVFREELAPKIKLFKIEAPEVARKARPGQFIILRIDEEGERIPLTIADYDTNAGTITLIFQEVGKTTELLGELREGDSILDFVGPLGCPSEIENFGTVVCVGGGVGVAPVYPIARALKEAGNRVVSIIGARTRDMLIWENEMRQISSELYVATDDGTAGRKGFVTDVLVDVLARKKVDKVVAIGPVVMMQAVCRVTPETVPVTVSLNPIMVDGTGMCGACRVEVGDATRFACVDGPEFDGHQVNWELVLQRSRMFVEEERLAMQSFHRKGGCKCQK
ncbi:MAG: sulfide/dihydroorotate dehydrogenase-like FAD/NAD-binding protein [Syntrophothermus sp.]|uniref:sulfide/dihydroorotate dehydrogenase-like FAD/NAD-binding protein n=1 Tax=Syntrophothermus sp. TaxID=2736299 RepID=UPI00257DE0DC|nr:sulfide/dihydroorotate dehydrogenase-like FAD/NAD-binding protein [Syntrophothermus sp.]NSW82870.1 sulfide/dihydroorotate dehydrogenase-like FAD/NAD-binding protein [Syntrophothermus sp.]